MGKGDGVLKNTFLYKLYYRLRYKELKILYPYIMNKIELNKYLFEKLNSNDNFFSAKLGSEELKVINQFKNKNFTENLKYTISNNAGFFPPTDENLEKLALLYLEAIKDLDMLAVWFNKGELDLIKNNNISNLALTGDYHSPWLVDNPWSYALKNKKVLVIHPFEDSIKEQYKKRKYLFENKKVLPEFELQTLKAVQSIGGSHHTFTTWFEALDFMKNEIIKIDFDIALIGAGAYGLPLAHFCKKIGKKGLHLGGATQLLFGIYGERWKNSEEFKLINSYWKRPYEFEKPEAFKKVENGCYW